MVERRQNGETGIVAVHCLEGKEVWGLGKRGVWSRELAAAEEHIESRTPGRRGQLRESRPVSPRICRRSARRESDTKRASARRRLRGRAYIIGQAFVDAFGD